MHRERSEIRSQAFLGGSGRSAGAVSMEVVLARLDDLLHQRRRLRHATLTDVELMLADSDALIAAVKSGRLDAAVVVRPASGGSRRLDRRALRSQPYVLLAPSLLAGRTV